MKVFKVALAPALLATALILSSCGGKKKVVNSAAEAYPKDDVKEAGLVLQGDSDSGRAGKLKTVYFAYDSSQLASDAKDTLNNNASYLKEMGSIRIHGPDPLRATKLH